MVFDVPCVNIVSVNNIQPCIEPSPVLSRFNIELTHMGAVAPHLTSPATSLTTSCEMAAYTYLLWCCRITIKCIFYVELLFPHSGRGRGRTC